MGVLLTFWLSVGSMLTHHKHPPLPPLSVKQCSHDNKNSTFLTSTLNYDNYTYSEAIDGIWINNNRNQTTEVMPDAATHVISAILLLNILHNCRLLNYKLITFISILSASFFLELYAPCVNYKV